MTRKLTLKDVEREAAKHGATVEIDDVGRSTRGNVCAPDGKKWDGDLHSLVFDWWGTINRPTWPEEKQAALEDVINRMRGMTLIDVDPDEEDVW
jgi:hypothetical protein